MLVLFPPAPTSWVHLAGCSAQGSSDLSLRQGPGILGIWTPTNSKSVFFFCWLNFCFSLHANELGYWGILVGLTSQQGSWKNVESASMPSTPSLLVYIEIWYLEFFFFFFWLQTPGSLYKQSWAQAPVMLTWKIICCWIPSLDLTLK